MSLIYTRDMLTASTGYVDAVGRIAKALLPVDEKVLITMTSKGLLLDVIHKSRTASASTMLPSKFFASYNIQEENDMDSVMRGPNEIIYISLKALSRSIQLFVSWSYKFVSTDPDVSCDENRLRNKGDTSPSLKRFKAPHKSNKSAVKKKDRDMSLRVLFTYENDAELKMQCAIEGMRSTCRFPIFDTDLNPDHGPQLDQFRVQADVTLLKNGLYDIIRLIEKSDSESVSIKFGTHPPTLIVKCEGAGVTTEVGYRETSSLVESIKVDEAIEVKYTLKLITSIKEVFRSASRSRIRMDNAGVLNIQVMHKYDDEPWLLSYAFSPLEDM